MNPTPTTSDRADRAMRWIGDLDHPFYSDERQRYVWYEASAVGLQVFLTGQLLMIAIALIVAGRDALPYVMFAFPPFLLAAIATETYARRHDAPYFVRSSDFRRGRGAFALGLGALYLLGGLRVALDTDADGNYDISFLIGALAGFVGLAVGLWWRQRQADSVDVLAED